MGEPQAARCSVCGQAVKEEVSIPGVGLVCPDCLVAGRFLGSTSTLRLNYVAERLLEMSTDVQARIAGAVGDAEHLAKDQQFDAARQAFLAIAKEFREAGQPMLAFIVLNRALRLPGQSAEVYEELARATQGMDCERETIQHLKTASWLAMQSGDRALCERTLADLGQLAPGDDWIEKAHRRLDEKEQKPGKESTCRFCGRTAKEAGPLISGEQSSVCSGCVKQLMSLNGDKH
jgi:hypothetical protein